MSHGWFHQVYYQVEDTPLTSKYKKYRYWNTEDKRKLLHYHDEDCLGWTTISEKLGRTVRACQERYTKLKEKQMSLVATNEPWLQDQIIESAPDSDIAGANTLRQTLGNYGFSTGRQVPENIPSASNSCPFLGDGLLEYGSPTYRQIPEYTPSPSNPLPFGDILLDGPSNRLAILPTNNTTLLRYLTDINPTLSLVRQLNTYESNTKYFWWDIRQVRPWTSFNPSTISSIPDVNALLKISVPFAYFPAPPSRIFHPETEAELHSIYSTFYTTKLNAALALAEGNRCLFMRSSVGPNQPSFISSYIDDTSEVVYGRVIGLVKSSDRWNSGMRVEGNQKKVEYLRGLAHLHKCMRDYGCRYGFIMTEMEIVVVRNGTEGNPYFGYLEVQTIQLAEHDSIAEVDERELKMTALLALFYLHMLAGDVLLMGQVGWKADGTRSKCLPRDDWMPAPHIVEMREAKRCRAWVWPDEILKRKHRGRRAPHNRRTEEEIASSPSKGPTRRIVMSDHAFKMLSPFALKQTKPITRG